MFSYVPLIGLGPIQVSLFIQIRSPPCFHCSSLPPVLQDGCSSDPCSSLCSQPFCFREMGGFRPKARKKKKAQQHAKKNSHGSAALLGQEQGSPGDFAVSCFQSCLCMGKQCLELKVWVHQLH